MTKAAKRLARLQELADAQEWDLALQLVDGWLAEQRKGGAVEPDQLGLLQSRARLLGGPLGRLREAAYAYREILGHLGGASDDHVAYRLALSADLADVLTRLEATDELARLGAEICAARPWSRRPPRPDPELDDDANSEWRAAVLTLARLAERLSRFDEAEDAYRALISAAPASIEVTDPAATAVNNLGLLLSKLGRHEEAADRIGTFLQAVSAVAEDALVQLATGLHNLAVVGHARGADREAEVACRRARVLWELAPGDHRVSMAAADDLLAVTLQAQGDLAAARPMFEAGLRTRAELLGEVHPGYAATLNNLGALDLELGHIDAAAAALGRAAEILRDALGENHPDYARTLVNLSRVADASGDTDTACQRAEQARAILMATLGEDSADTIGITTTLGTYEADRGNYERARKLCEDAVRRYARRDATGSASAPSRPAAGAGTAGADETADARYPAALMNLGHVLATEGDHRTAMGMFAEARATAERVLGPRHPTVAAILANLADSLLETGDLGAAEQVARQALALRREVLGPRHPEVAMILNNLGNILLRAGRYAEGIPLLGQAADLRREILPAAHPDRARSANNLAVAYAEIGDLAEAEKGYRAALRQWVDILGRDHPDVALARTNLGQLLTHREHFTEAEAELLEALRIRRAAAGDSHPDVADTLSALGNLWLRTNDVDRATGALTDALEIRRAAHGDSHPDVARALNNLGTLHLGHGDIVSAERLLAEAVEVAARALGPRHPDLSGMLTNLATVDIMAGRTRSAFDRLVRASRIDDEAMLDVFAISADRRRLEFLASLRATYCALIALLVDQAALNVSGSESLGEADVRVILDIVLRRKGIATEILAAGRREAIQSADPAVAGALVELTTVSGRIAQHILAGPEATGSERYAETLDELQARAERLEISLAQDRGRAFAASLLHAAGLDAAPTVPSDQMGGENDLVSRIAHTLPAGAALVEIVEIDQLDSPVPGGAHRVGRTSHCLAFVIGSAATAAPSVTVVRLGDPATIDAAIADFRVDLTNDQNRAPGPPRNLVPAGGRPRSHWWDTGRALAGLVLDPLLPALGGATELIIGPDGDLARLPFDVLPLDETSLAADSFVISYLGTGRDLLRDAARPSSAPPVVIADPDYDAPPELGAVGGSASMPPTPQGPFGPLPATREEGRQVAMMLGVEPVMGSAATKAFVGGLRSPRILHIATHGFALPAIDRSDEPIPPGARRTVVTQPRFALLLAADDPELRSGLALAGINRWLRGESTPDDVGDGIVNARDIASLDLTGTELVVMSACETGLGLVQVGEAVFGLRRAFAVAGANTLITSLWAVPDEQTRTLMEHFYRRLLAGDGVRHALRDAQARVRRDHPHPWYWGGFICQGAAGPIGSA
ncbi:CHAT domain-containing tetratricopeptide repeat protein [Frankia gtarii]|uniref:CHAT domain-containing tetratricopeptide repeat protein n=1 Tax=Frankia gtarii TaxID=2950102 RepID=UPI0021BFC901|nr:CHAT domain-containing protein [Frankia gtarii]